MTSELNAHGNLMGGVRKATKSQRLSISKKTKARLNEKSEQVNEKRAAKRGELTGKTPSATSVRTALAEGKITPAEAANLNPKGGLRPKAADVRAAYKGKHISREEASDLNPSANLDTDRGSGSKAKATGNAKPQGPIKVSSERIYKTKEDSTDKAKLGFVKSELPTHGPGSEYNPNAGRQWNTNG